jgi:hypothetical protein
MLEVLRKPSCCNTSRERPEMFFAHRNYKTQDLCGNYRSFAESLRFQARVIMQTRSMRYTKSRLQGLIAGVMPVILFIGLCGCGAATRQKQSGKSEFDLTDRFSLISPRAEPGEKEFDAHFEVYRNGQRRDSMILTAPAAIHASLAGFSGNMLLEGLATPVFNVGDGIQMDIFLRRNGTGKLIYNRYFDAGRRAEDRDWIPLSIPLELGISGDNWLEIRVSAGPQGNYTADWLALNAMHIVPR